MILDVTPAELPQHPAQTLRAAFASGVNPIARAAARAQGAGNKGGGHDPLLCPGAMLVQYGVGEGEWADWEEQVLPCPSCEEAEEGYRTLIAGL